MLCGLYVALGNVFNTLECNLVIPSFCLSSSLFLNPLFSFSPPFKCYETSKNQRRYDFARENRVALHTRTVSPTVAYTQSENKEEAHGCFSGFRLKKLKCEFELDLITFITTVLQQRSRNFSTRNFVFPWNRRT